MYQYHVYCTYNHVYCIIIGNSVAVRDIASWIEQRTCSRRWRILYQNMKQQTRQFGLTWFQLEQSLYDDKHYELVQTTWGRKLLRLMVWYPVFMETKENCQNTHVLSSKLHELWTLLSTMVMFMLFHCLDDYEGLVAEDEGSCTKTWSDKVASLGILWFQLEHSLQDD